jgi:hypothetical protein
MPDTAMVGAPKYERVADDAYFTPSWCVDALLSKWRPGCPVWEPAAGHGNIVEVLDRHGIGTTATDINEYVDLTRDLIIEAADFLRTNPYPAFSGMFSIITNPPYDKAEQFVRYALQLTEPVNGSVAMLLRHEWDCAGGRKDLFTLPAFKMKLVLTKRPRWFSDTKTSPRHNFSWFIWDWANTGKPTLGYAP